VGWVDRRGGKSKAKTQILWKIRLLWLANYAFFLLETFALELKYHARCAAPCCFVRGEEKGGMGSARRGRMEEMKQKLKIYVIKTLRAGTTILFIPQVLLKSQNEGLVRCCIAFCCVKSNMGREVERVAGGREVLCVCAFLAPVSHHHRPHYTPKQAMESFEEALVGWRGLVPGEMTLLTDEDPLADGHALLLHLLAQALRQGMRVYCLAAAAPQSHYTAVLRKLGVDKAKLDEEGGMIVYAPLLPTRAPPPPDAGGPPDVAMAPLLRDLVGYLREHQGGHQPVVVVIDDLSLVAGVYGTRAAVELVQVCRGLLLRRQPSASLLIRVLGNEEEDDDGDINDEDNSGGAPSISLLALLLRTADALVEVRPLTSGYSRDVHGLITVRPRPGARPELLNFKLGEGGLKCGRLTASSAVVGMGRTFS